LQAAQQKEAKGWELISCSMDSYEPWYQGKRGMNYNSVGGSQSVLGLMANVGANLVHNAKEITNVILFFRKMGPRDPRPPKLQAELLHAGGFETSSGLVKKIETFMQGKDIVSVTVDSYMPTSFSGSRNEQSYAIIMYR
jgi:hypothetical protein